MSKIKLLGTSASRCLRQFGIGKTEGYEVEGIICNTKMPELHGKEPITVQDVHGIEYYNNKFGPWSSFTAQEVADLVNAIKQTKYGFCQPSLSKDNLLSGVFDMSIIDPHGYSTPSSAWICTQSEFSLVKKASAGSMPRFTGVFFEPMKEKIYTHVSSERVAVFRTESIEMLLRNVSNGEVLEAVSEQALREANVEHDIDNEMLLFNMMGYGLEFIPNSSHAIHMNNGRISNRNVVRIACWLFREDQRLVVWDEVKAEEVELTLEELGKMA